ncbi:MAG: hypothetical protein WCI27_11835 [Candidatus Omnitrophota bacterium]
MFVRQKKNKSGSVSVQIIDKSDGYRVFQTVGAAKDQDKINLLVQKARHIIQTCGGKQSELFSFQTAEEAAVKRFLGQLSNQQVRVVGPELIFGALFDRLGFGSIPEALFRHIVIARLAHPVSKLKTVDYLYRYQGVTVDADSIY